MKHTSVPLFGTGWVRASIWSMRSRLFRSLLSRFVPPVYHDPYRSPFGVPARSVLFSIDPHRSCRAYLIGHFPSFSLQAAQRIAPGHDSLTVTCLQCRSGCDDFTVSGHSLTAIPFWQLN
ncbi:hypothetical protein FGF66_08150 [Chlorobaculum thiosulfatiphilum]|uniref:Uncharacterized protein n=1 Tax=Chlorobaculum thiosulfatiphilum TaxID=115852 RepID=A0A5C4S5V2_CHLTI|nr:hypothetical protein [Chlorobaculum thiosulfatiphilum]TNJ38608.1 hypothetical protein FGF66_08150 [Chlorobaculum thiosulfatiphilum]